MKEKIISALRTIISYNEKFNKKYNAFFERHPEVKKHETTRYAFIVALMVCIYFMDLVGIVNITSN